MIDRRDKGDEDAGLVGWDGFGVAHGVISVSFCARTDTHEIIAEAELTITALEEDHLPCLSLEGGVVGLPVSTRREIQGNLHRHLIQPGKGSKMKIKAVFDGCDGQFARRRWQGIHAAFLKGFLPLFGRHGAVERQFVAGFVEFLDAG